METVTVKHGLQIHLADSLEHTNEEGVDSLVNLNGVRGTRVIANPMGYCKGVKVVAIPDQLRRENPNFNPRLVVKI